MRPGVSFGREDFRQSSRGARPQQLSLEQVYVIQGSHGLVKVGYSGNPVKRLAELQTGSPYALTLAYSTRVPNAYAVEQEAHAILSRHRQSGEWFAVPVDVAVAAINGAAYRVGAIEEADAVRQSWWRRFVIGTCIATPTWLFLSPTIMAVSVFVMAVYASYRVANYHGERSLALTAKWAGLIIASIAASMLVAAVMLAVVSPAKADEAIPTYDSAKYCLNLSALMGNSDFFKSSCAITEASSRTKIDRVWSSTPDDIKDQCIKIIAAGSSGTYQALSGCLSVSMGNLWLDGKVRLVR